MYGPNTELTFATKVEAKRTGLAALFPCGRIFTRTRIPNNATPEEVIRRCNNFRDYAYKKLQSVSITSSVATHLL